MKTTLLAMLIAGTAVGQTVEYLNEFTGVEGDTGETFTANIGLEFVGNGDEGGGYWEASSASIVVQSYGSRQVEIGIGSFVMSGLTLEAGTEYTFTARMDEDRNTWSNGRNVFLGLNDPSTPRPTTPAPFADYTTDFAFNEVELADNSDFVLGPYNDIVWTFTPASTLVDPVFVLGTKADDVNILLDGRIRLYTLSVTSGSGGSLPGCNIADVAEPYGILDLSDISAFVASFTGGCP